MSFEYHLNSYIETALWSSTLDDDEPMDSKYSQADLAEETLEKMKDNLFKFLNIIEAQDLHTEEGHYAHDFWLTRNGHGAGFFDGDYPINGDALTEVANRFGSYELYVGDDGKIYGM